MNFYEYQELSTRTLNTGINKILNASNLAMGLAGEAGETVDYLKKIYYHGHDLSKEKLRDELGDVLWYISSLAYIHDIDLIDVAECNVEKLKKRYPEGFSESDSIKRKDVT